MKSKIQIVPASVKTITLLSLLTLLVLQWNIFLLYLWALNVHVVLTFTDGSSKHVFSMCRKKNEM